MKKVGPPWLGAVVATSLSFFFFLLSVLFFYNPDEFKTVIYGATESAEWLWDFYIKIKNFCLELIVLYADANDKPLKLVVISAAIIVFAAQFGISKESKIKYTFSEMYESFWEITHPYVNMKCVGFFVYSSYIINLLMLFIGIWNSDFPTILLSSVSVLILQFNGWKNSKDVKEWKMSLYYERQSSNQKDKES